MNFKHLFLAVLLLGFLSCEKHDNEKDNNGIFPNEDTNIVGNWELKSVSGGFTGRGYVPTFKYLNIEPNGEFICSNDTITLSKGLIKTENDEDNQLSLVFNTSYSMDGLNMSTFPKKITNYSSNGFFLVDPCCDLYCYEFIKASK